MFSSEAKSFVFDVCPLILCILLGYVKTDTKLFA